MKKMGMFGKIEEDNQHLNTAEDNSNVIFVYKKIQELGDRYEQLKQETGNSTSAAQVVKSEIIKNNHQGNNPLFQNDKILVNINSFIVGESEKVEIKVEIISPTVYENLGRNLEIQQFPLNGHEIEEYINETSKKIETIEIALSKGFSLRNNSSMIQKETSNFQGSKEQVSFIRGQILNLYKQENIITVKQISLNEYHLIHHDFHLTVFIEGNQIKLSGGLDKILEINSIFPHVENIIKESKSITGETDNEIVVDDSKWSLIKNFLGKTEDKEQITINGGVSILNPTKIEIQKMQENLFPKDFLVEIKNNLELGNLDNFSKIDQSIIEAGKDVILQLINEINEIYEELQNNKSYNTLLYLYHLQNTFQKIKNGEVKTLYSYMILNKLHKSGNGQTIRQYLKKQYKNPLQQITKGKDVQNYSFHQESLYNMRLIPETQSIAFTNEENKIKVFNLVSQQTKRVSKDTDHYSITTDCKYAIYRHSFLDSSKRKIINLDNGAKIAAERAFSTTRGEDYKYYSTQNSFIKVESKKILIYLLDKKNHIEINIEVKNNRLITHKENLFFIEELEDEDALFQYDIKSEQIKKLSGVIGRYEEFVNFHSNDNCLFVVIKNQNGEYILKQFYIKDKVVDMDSQKSIDLTCIKEALIKKHFFINNEGIMVCESQNQLQVLDLNEDKLNLRKIKIEQKINHIYQIIFINSPEYGNKAICRDGGQIYEVDLDLINNLHEPTKIEELNEEIRKQIEEKRQEENRQKEEAEKAAAIEEEKETANFIDIKSLEGVDDVNIAMLIELQESRKLQIGMLEKMRIMADEITMMRKEINKIKKK